MINADSKKAGCYNTVVNIDVDKGGVEFGSIGHTVKCYKQQKTDILSVQLTIGLFKNTYLGNPTLEDWKMALELAFDEIKKDAIRSY